LKENNLKKILHIELKQILNQKKRRLEMIQRLEKNGEERVKGIVQATGRNSIKVNDKWYTFSKFLSEAPQLNVGENIEFISSRNFVTKIIAISKPNGKNPETAENEVEQKLLNALRSAASIASILEKEVSIKFSAQDIIKLAITLFIQNS
jgi:hypothetical protein